jgi:hypothetical protein
VARLLPIFGLQAIASHKIGKYGDSFFAFMNRRAVLNRLDLASGELLSRLSFDEIVHIDSGRRIDCSTTGAMMPQLYAAMIMADTICLYACIMKIP